MTPVIILFLSWLIGSFFKSFCPMTVILLQLLLCIHQIFPNTTLGAVGAGVLIFRATHSHTSCPLKKPPRGHSAERAFQVRAPFPNLHKSTLQLPKHAASGAASAQWGHLFLM